MIRQQKLLNAPLRFLYITAIGMIADCLFERAYLVHLVRLLHLAGLFGTLRASGNLKVVKRKNTQILSRSERYSSTDIPIIFMLFLIIITGTSLYLGITMGRFAPG